jgi:hypothetical protein
MLFNAGFNLSWTSSLLPNSVSEDNKRYWIQHSYPDPLVSGMDPRIRILTNVMAPEEWFIALQQSSYPDQVKI